MPVPEMSREEYNGYRKTILQFHLYEFIFKEATVGSEDMADPLSAAVPNAPLKSGPMFADELAVLENALPKLVEEVG